MFVLMELISGILVKFCSSVSCYERSRNKLNYRIWRLNWTVSGSKTWFYETGWCVNWKLTVFYMPWQILILDYI